MGLDESWRQGLSPSPAPEGSLPRSIQSISHRLIFLPDNSIRGNALFTHFPEHKRKAPSRQGFPVPSFIPQTSQCPYWALSPGRTVLCPSGRPLSWGSCRDTQGSCPAPSPSVAGWEGRVRDRLEVADEDRAPGSALWIPLCLTAPLRLTRGQISLLTTRGKYLLSLDDRT